MTPEPPSHQLSESDLYLPVKLHLEALGYTVRGEVGRCDMVGVNDTAIVAVELKLTFGLPVLYQALNRLPTVDLVYVAVAAPIGRTARRNWDARLADAVRLCRMLGVGLLSLRDGTLFVHADPSPYQPRKRPKLRARLLSEFSRRTGDHNVGGTTKRPRITAYREEALACANLLARYGPTKVSAVRDAIRIQSVGNILRDNVYGWFTKVARATYDLTPTGRSALDLYASVVSAWTVGSPMLNNRMLDIPARDQDDIIQPTDRVRQK